MAGGRAASKMYIPDRNNKTIEIKYGVRIGGEDNNNDWKSFSNVKWIEGNLNLRLR